MKNLSLLLLLLVLATGVPASARMTLDTPATASSSQKVRIGSAKTIKHQEDADSFFGAVLTQGIGFETLRWNPLDGDHFETGNGWGVSYSMDYASRFGVRVSYERINTRAKSTPEIASGDVTIQPISIAGRYFPFKSRRLRPFVSVGGEYILFDTSVDASEQAFWNSFGLQFSQHLQSNFGFQYGAGVEIYAIPDRLSIGLEYKRLVISTTVDKKVVVNSTGDQFPFSSSVDAGGGASSIDVLFHF